MDIRWLPAAFLTFALAGCSGSDDDAATAPPAAVDAGGMHRFEVVSVQDAFAGATPVGAAGPYVIVSGIAHGKLNPQHADNAGIADLDKLPTDADGFVHYSTDVAILRPKDPATARRVLFYDVVNRGNKSTGQGRFIGGNDLVSGAPPAAAFPSLLQEGYTVVWSGWQGDVAQTGEGATKTVGTNFPLAVNKDGSLLTGLSREETVGGTSVSLQYPPASLADRSEVVFTARPSWIDASGRQDSAVPSTPVTQWNYVLAADGSVSVSFTPPATIADRNGNPVATDAGTIYNFVYRASNAKVFGVGFAAVRDLVAFLRYENTDRAGNANPLSDMKKAVCAAQVNCAANPATNFDVTLGEGISQSGRFLRDFLHQGFNKDAAGRRVFDGVMPIIPGGRKTWTNVRFAQPGRWSKQHEEHFQVGDQFPFAYNVFTDPVSGVQDGILKRCTESATCPKVMQVDGSFEWWGGRGSLVVTDGAGRDLTLPDNVRYYVVAGTGHGGGSGVTTGSLNVPAATASCYLPNSPVTVNAPLRALARRLEAWVSTGALPPASRYPMVASGSAVPVDLAAVGFADTRALTVPSGADAALRPLAFDIDFNSVINQVFLTDYATAMPKVDLAKRYVQVVSKVDTTSNEVAGVLMPEVQVPLASYTGWNIRQATARGEACGTGGGAIPLAVDDAQRAPGDVRPSLASLYTGRADYAAKFSAAAQGLVEQGFLLQQDADAIYKAGAANVRPALIPNP